VYRNWWALPVTKLGFGLILELRNGLRYQVRPHTTDLATINETSILNPYLAAGHVTVSEDAVVVDVGANIGDFTLHVARLCPQGRVFAIEPVDEHVRMIETNVRLNGIRNVTCVRRALGAAEGHADIQVAGIRSNVGGGVGTRERVPSSTLPQFVKEQRIERIDLLKLDCEGAEWDILPASESALPRIRQICMEFHCERGWTPERLALWLRERGYRVRHTPGPWNGLLWGVRE
jgi:FkbM family methyltransferase